MYVLIDVDRDRDDGHCNRMTVYIYVCVYPKQGWLHDKSKVNAFTAP